MFLKKIYVNGFKSFAEKTEIVIEKGITAIVGPNGSGKSNISDAIKWVLGEQSAKSLRGGKMDDIIFAGTEKRMPLGYSEVNLVFDNQTGIIPIEYNEVSIKRKLYKTGESEYYINKQQCRLKDIKELFMDTGIGRDGYSFIGQGRVEDILSPNSETRREVFEEAAGIVKYKTRKEEAIRKLDKTTDNLDRVEDIVHELEQRIEPLREQSEKANKYIELKSELKKYELNYFVHEYEKHNEQLVALEEQKKQSVIQKESFQKKRDSLERTITTEKEKINNLQATLTELENIQSAKNKEYENYLSLSNIQNEKRLLYQNNIQNVTQEIEELENRNKELQNNINAIKLEKDILCENLKNELAKFDELNVEVEGYKAEIDNIIKLIDNEKNNLFELHKEINKMNSSKNTLESFVKNSEERVEQLSKEILSEESEKENKENIIKILKQQQDDTKIYLSIKKHEGNEILDKLKKSENQKSNKENEIKDISNKLSSINSKLSILNNMEAYYDGYYKSVKTLMNNKDKNEMLNKSILGTVADIVKTKKEYETAIEISLSSSIQNVIVNSESEASDIIEYLKTSKIGRVTFLPIEMIQERTLNNSEKSVLSDPCVINTADMLIDTDPKFKKVIKHLLGRIIVVDDLKNGFKISRRLGNSVKIVSLQGDVINSGGSVTGGHISSNQNLLGRKREIEECKELSIEYTYDLQNRNDELNNLLNDIKSYNEIIENIKNDINEKNNSYNMSESKINMLQEQLNRTSITIKKYLDEKQYIVDEKSKYQEEIFKIEKQIEENKNIIEEREKNIEIIISQNESNRKNFEEYNSIILNKREQVSELRQEIKLKEEKISNIDFEINRNINLKSQKEENLKNIETEISTATCLIEEYLQKTEILSKELSQINLNHQEDKTNLLNFQNQIYEYQNIINETNKNITLLLDDENNMNVKIEREKSKVEDISTKFWEEYEMNYAMALGYKDESISYSRLYSDLNSYKKEIKDLGNINIDAIEEYKEVKERYDFLSIQKKDLLEAKTQLNDVIKDLEIKMRDKFLDEFASIRIKFNEVFKKLFNGGNGDVYIEDESDALNSNIEIAVQPPGKKLSKISLLSGGEKSLTAIALLFAILKTKPTPFCILDEIEAALDDVNIFRFTQYLREFSKETQFLVITHRKGTMEYADTLYGATMEEKGVTKLVSLKLSDVDY